MTAHQVLPDLSKEELAEAAQHLIHSPHYATRRVTLTPCQLTEVVTQHLMGRGMPRVDLDDARWVWTTDGDTGMPCLAIVLPGMDS